MLRHSSQPSGHTIHALVDFPPSRLVATLLHHFFSSCLTISSSSPTFFIASSSASFLCFGLHFHPFFIKSHRTSWLRILLPPACLPPKLANLPSSARPLLNPSLLPRSRRQLQFPPPPQNSPPRRKVVLRRSLLVSAPSNSCTPASRVVPRIHRFLVTLVANLSDVLQNP